MLGYFSKFVMIGVAVAAGMGAFSFWWALIPVFLAGSLALSNGPHYEIVMRANERGSLTIFPLMLVIYCAGQLALAGIAYWIGTLFG